MKQAAETAIQPLLETLELDTNEAVRDAAAQSLARIGPAALPILLRYLEHPDVAVRWRVAKSIGEVRPRANTAQTAVVGLLSDADEHLRVTACETLYEIRADRERYVEPLINLLASSDRDVRMRAMKLLIRTGPPTSRDLSQLEALRLDPRSHIRNTARITIAKLEAAYATSTNE
jgi:HEAT repeat protein